MNLFGIAAAGALAAGWGYLGYRGWTWIPHWPPGAKKSNPCSLCGRQHHLRRIDSQLVQIQLSP